MHGGARGSGAPRANQNARKHGLFTREAIAERRQIQALLGEARKLLEEMKRVGFAASLATYAAFNLRAFFARTGNLLSTENPTFSARMMVAIVSKRGLAPGASVL